MNQSEEKNQDPGKNIALSETKTLPQLIEEADHKAKAIIAVREAGIRNTVPSDWTKQGDKPYLTGDAAISVMQLFNAEIFNCQHLPMETIVHKEGPDELIFSISGSVSIPGLGVYPALGSCSTRDDFLGKSGGKWKPLTDIKIPHIKKKAHTNMVGNAVRHALKLNGLSWKEWERMTGFKQEEIVAVEYMGGSKKGAIGPEAQAMVDEMKAWSLEIFNGDGKATSDYIFQLTDNPDKGYKGKKRFEHLSEAQITKFLHPIFKQKYEKFKKDEIPAGEK